MLKALELYGFKSFADKTRFEFPPGITVVVGPNGSGKSNIVDCIKWVLGEQSAKSLRGKDMADVIFKGSGTSGRKPMNTAEATLIFDNADRKLPVDAPEVHVTRRVYRSGEGEYLINRQPARLKDIRDMFRGTGVGGDAYSLIEQGKVDRLLQATAKDRRAIFEEAAGISRFKAKKIETQRRLERVEQNLLRLSDIVEEVENRLKTVRAQAGKARRYREYSERLQQLRTQIALVDWRRLSEQLVRIEADLFAITQEVHAADAEAQRLESRQIDLECVAQAAADEVRECEGAIADIRRQVAQEQATIDHERSRALELEEEANLHRRNLLAMSDKAGDLRLRLKTTQADVADAEHHQQVAAEELTRRESTLAALTKVHERARQQVDASRQHFVAQLQSAAAIARQVEAGETQLAAAHQEVTRQQEQLVELAANEQDLAPQLAAARTKQTELSTAIAGHQEQLEAATNELAENRNLHASRAEDLSQLHSRRQGVSERAEVLEEFERTLEGVGAGVKQILARAGARNRNSGIENLQGSSTPESASTPDARNPLSLIRGVVADCLQASIEHAAAIDVALGELAQAVVVEGRHEAIQSLIVGAGGLAGRVIAVPALGTPYSVLSTKQSTHGTSISGSPNIEFGPIELTAEMVRGVQVIARADKLVECSAEYRPLVTHLLGRTFVVRSLEDAVRLKAKAAPGTRLVTQTGELIDELGAIAFGPPTRGGSATGLVSRKSQLHAARLDLAVLDQQIADAQRETAHLKREVERHEQAVRQLFEEGKSLEQHAAANQTLLQTLAERADRLQQQKSQIQAALTQGEAHCEEIDSALRQASQELSRAQTTADSIQAQIAGQESELASLESQRLTVSEEVTTAKVELARCQQRLESLSLRLTQFEEDQRERERGVSLVREQLRQAQGRHAASQFTMLRASANIATLALHREALDRRLESCLVNRDDAIATRAALADQLTALRRRALKLRDQEHEHSLDAEQVRHERKTLADRLREDYNIELSDLAHPDSPERAQERAAVEEEIESLRRKINQIGAVNLDALEELDDLEDRFAKLSSQHQDLTAAKQSLERIIHKINADSRRLFLETLEAIRVNFQALYRKAFGGGKADILLEEGIDVLDCGVEIVATPPGKPSFNNSLLSGGEKALTAVALLLAIFQFRPSPFCVLDEVDAPFDEANIGRFIDVLKDFLSWTRFVIVTHSKKTMTAATTLYGVTMQESGVSKRVSVRFDDISDDGHIRPEALGRAIADDAAESAA